MPAATVPTQQKRRNCCTFLSFIISCMLIPAAKLRCFFQSCKFYAFFYSFATTTAMVLRRR